MISCNRLNWLVATYHIVLSIGNAHTSYCTEQSTHSNIHTSEVDKAKLEITCVGMLPSAGYRTQLRHIFMTMSSRNITISCVQYCSLHGLLVNTANGRAVRTSSVIQFGIAGLPNTCIPYNSITHIHWPFQLTLS